MYFAMSTGYICIYYSIKCNAEPWISFTNRSQKCFIIESEEIQRIRTIRKGTYEWGNLEDHQQDIENIKILTNIHAIVVGSKNAS